MKARLCFKGMTAAWLVYSLSACTFIGTDENWKRENVEQSLGTTIPVDARHVTYTGYTPHGGYLDLRFEASPESAATFVEHFCDGRLFQGFDPFNAVVVDQSTAGAHRIDMGYFIYYALSRNTADTLYGVRCPFFRVTIDRSGADMNSIHVLQQFHHHDPGEIPAEFTGTPFFEP